MAKIEKFAEKYLNRVDLGEDLEMAILSSGETLFEVDPDSELKSNEFVVVENENDGSMQLLRYVRGIHSLKKLTGKSSVKDLGSGRDIKPRGLEQIAAMESMYDPSIQLVVLHGIAGSGKTFLACAAAMELVEGKKAQELKGKYDNIVVMRPVSYVGASLGLTPGTAQEKYADFIAPVKKHLDDSFPDKVKKMLAEETLVFAPIEHIRGAEFKNSIVILDEAQNTTPHEMLTILTRMHETSKLFICGDTDQVDNGGDLKTSNGLTKVIQNMQNGKDDDVSIVEFFKSERKGISLKAVQRRHALLG